MLQRKVDLSALPKNRNGGICWLSCKGYKIPFIYDEIQGEFEIIDIHQNNNKKVMLDVRYNGKEIKAVPSSSVKQGIIGRIIGTKSFEFKTMIGQQFDDEKRDYIIVNQRRAPLKSKPNYTQRQVQILCNKCGIETWMAEERVLEPKNCACGKCRYSPKSGKKSIVETDAWMIPFFQGGYEEAKLYTRGQGKKLKFICPYCKKKRNQSISIAVLARTHSIGCSCPWSKMPSFPQRLFKALLDELSVKYIQECNNGDLHWITSYRYDFYLPDFHVIVELHGKEHYVEGTGYYKNSLKEIQENDEKKKELACNEGEVLESNYIVIDCKKSMTDYIKQNIQNSGLVDIFGVDLEKVDWFLLTEKAWKSEKIEISRYIKEHPEESVRLIAEKFKVSRDMIKEIQENMGIYDSEKEKRLGVEHQKELFLQKMEDRDYEICKIKIQNPNFTTNDIAKITGMERHTILRILRRRGLYDEKMEKENRYLKISKIRKEKRVDDYEEICKYKIDSPSISAKEVGRQTGHAHGYINRIWRENGLL